MVVGTVVISTVELDAAELIGAVDGEEEIVALLDPLLIGALVAASLDAVAAGAEAESEEVVAVGVEESAVELVTTAVRIGVSADAVDGSGTAGEALWRFGVAGAEVVTTGELCSALLSPLTAEEPGSGAAGFGFGVADSE